MTEATPISVSMIPDHPSAVALMDAMDRLLGEIGYAGISSRKITDEAGLAHGSIRYHFGSLRGLLVATLGRRNQELYRRQSALYRSDRPTLETWRIATRDYFEADLESGWALRLIEAMIIGIRDPEAAKALEEHFGPWRELLSEATRTAVEEYGLDLPDRIVEGIATLVETSQLGMLVYRLAGNDTHHDDALDAIDALLQWLEARSRKEERDEAEGA